MNTTQRKKLLIDCKLTDADFYVVSDEFGDKIVIRRTGMDKIEVANPQYKFSVESITTVPYGDKVCTTILGRLSEGSGSIITTASANPDTCQRGQYNYAEIAEKRCRHRLILKAMKLYQHDIYSEVEADWSAKKVKSGDAVNSEVEKLLKK